MNLNKLRDKAYQCAITHGWHEENLSNEHYLCLVISELMKAVEADRKDRCANISKFNDKIDFYLHEMNLSGDEFNKSFIDAFNTFVKDTVEDELADACIRIFDLAGLRNIFLRRSVGYTVEEYKTFTENIYKIISELTNPKYAVSSNLNYTLSQIKKLSELLKIDILWHIEQKMKYNELRPYKHGNKNY